MRLFRHVFTATCKSHPAHYQKCPARAHKFMSLKPRSGTARCVTSRSIQVAAGFLPVEGTAGAQVLRVRIDEVRMSHST